jgi:hypothetical protein
MLLVVGVEDFCPSRVRRTSGDEGGLKRLDLRHDYTHCQCLFPTQ